MGHRPQQIAGAAERIVVGVLQAQLHAGDVAAVERRGQDVAERFRVNTLRRDRIQAAAGCAGSVDRNQALPL
jgi:hypothetical protein